MTTRIRWEPTEHGGWTGHAGTLKSWLFQVFRPEHAGEDWALMSQFPGTLGKYHLRRDPDELKAEAERWLEEFVSSLGAIFPEDETSDDDDEPPEVMWAAGRRVRFAHPGAGYPGEAEDAARHLTPGGVYTIAWADISQSRTDLNLAAGGKPAGRYNSVFFEPADDRETAVKAAGEE